MAGTHGGLDCNNSYMLDMRSMADHARAAISSRGRSAQKSRPAFLKPPDRQPAPAHPCRLPPELTLTNRSMLHLLANRRLNFTAKAKFRRRIVTGWTFRFHLDVKIWSGRVAVVVPDHAAAAGPAPDLACRGYLRRWPRRSIAQALARSLRVDQRNSRASLGSCLFSPFKQLGPSF